MKEIHVEHWVQAKEKRNDEIKSIIIHILGDGVQSIKKWENISMGPSKAFFLQMQPNFFAHLKLMWHPVLIMALLVLVIGPL